MLAYIAPVLAQQPPSVADARFQVSGYAVEGRALLRSEDFTRVVSPYVGRGKTAADLERARLALQDTYHDLGHCTVRVALAHPAPRDGMVTFRVAEVPASEVRDCLPAVVLDEPAGRGPVASVAPGNAGAATAFSYADPRDPAAPALKPRTPPAAGAPRGESVGQAASAPAGAAPLRRPDPPASSTTVVTRVAAAESGQAAAASGVSVAPHVEGAGARGLSVLSEAPAQDTPRPQDSPRPEAPAKPVATALEPAKPAPATAPTAPVAEARPPAAAPVVAAVEPAKPVPATPASTASHGDARTRPAVQPEPAKSAATQVLAEAKNPTDGRAPFVGTAVAVADPQPAAARPPVVAQAEPVKPPPPAKAAPPAPATVPVAPAAPKFEIARYDVEGNTLLKPEVVDRALAPFSGPDKDFGDVQRALEALQLAYQNEGWGGVEIRLPEQELDRGVVRLRVVEPRIAKITVEGNEHFSEANIRRSVPALREGETPNSREIAKGIRLANENPSKQSAVVLRASEREDHLDATIRVADVDPRRYSIALDNTGNEETQRERLGLAYQHSNMFGLDHVMTLQFITAPKNYNDVIVFGLGYRIPIYSRGDSVDFVAGYSNVDSGTVQDLFVVAGAGTVFALRYNQNLPRWGDLEHRFSYGFDYRAYQNDVTPVGSDFKLVPDITVHPVSVTYSGAWRAEGKGELTYYLSAVQNIPGGSDGRDENFKAVGARFPDGTAGYRLYRAGVSYSRPLIEDWQIRIRADGQYTDDALVSGEMFAIGGADSVRGVNERYVSNDKGYRTSWEIYTPDMAKGLGLDGRMRFLAFYDQGLLRRNKVQPGELEQQSLDTAGLGLRVNYKNNLTLRFDVAFVLHDGTTPLNTNGKDGQTKAHFALAWVW
jgi:hemolysin activation/secretion protein